MLDPSILKDNLEVLESNISRRNLKIDVNHLISLNEERNLYGLMQNKNVLNKRN